MEIILQDNLSHQTKPVMSVASVVEDSELIAADAPHRNPTIKGGLNSYTIRKAQEENNIALKFYRYVYNPWEYNTKAQDLPHYQMMDVRMETGTGKTYVYTRTMLELHKRCGFNKFIVAVPTLPIKEGAAAFLSDPYVQHHFSDICGYNTRIELCMLKTQKGKHKGRLNFPTVVSRFYKGNYRETNKIYVLLLNTQLLTTGKLLTRDDYDQMLDSFYRPIDAISDTRPILIIDEPHKVERNGTSFMSLIKNLNPQLVLRYGATFPEFSIGRGKKKIIQKDYVNLVYDLDAADAFSQTLIKGIAKEHVEAPDGKDSEKMVKITSVDSRKAVHLQYITPTKAPKSFELHSGESLSQIDSDFGALTVNVKTKSIELSNGQEKQVGEEFFPDQFSESYQRSMLQLALIRHFETERANFERKPTRIKTLALFFIDNIDSYRGAEGKNDGWLHEMFIGLLKEQVEKELEKKNTPEYVVFLKATLNDLDGSCAGYFSRDNQDSDESIAKEVDTILHGKKELLSFKTDKGKPNVCRFLFSKWTLKEGWDNPNVFTICKLRSSGSETSKLQEVGRGLRLPVDEAGNRIVDQSFMLNYIVDFTEKDFATKLVEEINKGIDRKPVEPLAITTMDIESVAKIRGVQPMALLIELMQNGYLDMDKKIVPDRYDDLLLEYPEFRNINFNTSRITNRNSKRDAKVGIRKARFEELHELWNRLNGKYVLYLDKDISSGLADVLPTIIKDRHVFAIQVANTSREVLAIDNHQAITEEAASTQLTMSGKRMPYNTFLKRASKLTSLPVETLHQAICKVAKEVGNINNNVFNENSLTRLVSAVDDWNTENLQGVVRYKQAHYSPLETRLTDSNGNVRDDVVQTYIGRKREGGKVMLSDKYLYDALVYDSQLERDNIMKSDIDDIIVYGKIPSSSICIPTVASSNYSPDFMYVIRRKDGAKELNVVIETKGYDGTRDIAPDQDAKISCAKEFFKEMRDSGYDVYFRPQINGTTVKNILQQLIEE